MKKQHKYNLIKLAIGLAKVQEHNTPRFDMQAYDCGSAACAIGFGQFLVTSKYTSEMWAEYSQRVFGVTDSDGSKGFWMFSSDWLLIDNTAKGAAARILYALSRGTPRNRITSRMAKYQEEAYAAFDRLLKEAQSHE